MFETLMQKAGLSTRSYGTQSSYNAVERAVHMAHNTNLDKTTNPIISYTPDNLFYDAYSQEIWAYVAVSAIAEACSQIPLRVFNMRNREQPVEVTYDKQFAAFLHPNSQMSKVRLWEATYSYLRLLGSCFWECSPDIAHVERIYVLRPDFMEIVPDAKRGIKSFLYYPKGKNSKDDTIRFSTEEVAYFHTYSPYSLTEGLSPLSPAKLSIAADLLAQHYNIAFYEQSASPHGIYTTDTVMNDAKLEKLTDQLITMRQGIKSFFTPVILHGGLRYQQVSLGPKEAALNEGRVMNRSDVLSSQRVPPTIAGISESNYAEAKSQAEVFKNHRLLPLLRAMEADLNTYIFRYMGSNLECMLDVQGVPEYRNDIESEGKLLNSEFDRGLLSINDYLKAIRRPLIDSELGNKRFVLASLYELNEGGQVIPVNPNVGDKSGRTGEGKAKQFRDLETGEIVDLQNILDSK